MLPVAILAGGLATRMGDHTRQTPKAMLDIAGRPFIAWQLETLARQGAERVVLCVKHLAEQIRDFVGDGRQFDLDVVYCEDGDRLLGTGGALRQALPLLGDAFFVTYGDSYLTLELADVERSFIEQRVPALMTVFRNEDRWDKSNVQVENGRLVLYSKTRRTAEMKYIDYGMGVLTAPLFDDAGLGEAFDVARLYEQLSEQGRLGCYEAITRFYEIGSVAGWRETSAVLGGETL
ncbi:nucleotidyltransferase family protein [soil metagenome]